MGSFFPYLCVILEWQSSLGQLKQLKTNPRKRFSQFITITLLNSNNTLSLLLFFFCYLPIFLFKLLANGAQISFIRDALSLD